MEKDMIKNLTILFGAGVAGIVVCLVMTIIVAVQGHQRKQTPQPLSIPTPAMVPAS